MKIDLEECISTAYNAHCGQVDKAGEPYLDHILRVCEKCKNRKELIVALFHDTVEDFPFLRQKVKELVGEHLFEAIVAISREPGEDDESYYSRVMQNDLAYRVKIYDLEDNSDEERLAKLEPKIADRLRKKYEKAKVILGVSNTLEDSPN